MHFLVPALVVKCLVSMSCRNQFVQHKHCVRLDSERENRSGIGSVYQSVFLMPRHHTPLSQHLWRTP